MKIVVVLMILLTIVMIFLEYKKTKNIKKLFIALGTMGIIFFLAILGNVTRQVIVLFIVHSVLLIFAWSALLVYLIKDRYYWWIIFSPILTIGLFLFLEFLTGSGHEIG